MNLRDRDKLIEEINSGELARVLKKLVLRLEKIEDEIESLGGRKVW